MGKKRVIKETEQEALKSGTDLEDAVTRAGGKKATKRVDLGKVFIKASYNNTLISVTDDRGNLIAWSSAGALGFAGPKKATPFAASKVIGVLAEKVKKTGPTNVEVFVNGVGGGRDSAVRSLTNHGFNIVSIRDVTPIPHNGPRPRKVRRV